MLTNAMVHYYVQTSYRQRIKSCLPYYSTLFGLRILLCSKGRGARKG